MTVVRMSRSLEDTRAIAALLAGALRPGDVLALEGPMGAGKTTLVRLLGEALGVPRGMVASPTFVLAHEYPTGAGFVLVHLDAYRLRSAEDLEAAGWDRLSGPDAVVVVEWPGRVQGLLPEGRVSRVTIRPVAGRSGSDPGVREIEIGGPVGTRLGG